MSGSKLFAQGVRFGLVGGLSTLIHVSVFILCIEILLMRPFVANFPAFFTAVLFGFAGHFSWTFKHQETAGRPRWRPALVKFIMVSIVGLGLNSTIVYGVVDILNLPYGYAIALMLTLTPAVVFALSKVWVFA